jgi:hypothetical protein
VRAAHRGRFIGFGRHALEQPQRECCEDGGHTKRQPLGDALNELAKQSRLQIVLFTQLGEGMSAPTLLGKYTATSALERLLDGTPLGYEFINPRTVAIEPKSAERKKTSSLSTVADGYPCTSPRRSHRAQRARAHRRTLAPQIPPLHARAIRSKRHVPTSRYRKSQ